jgi:hypothetical protein
MLGTISTVRVDFITLKPQVSDLQSFGLRGSCLPLFSGVYIVDNPLWISYVFFEEALSRLRLLSLGGQGKNAGMLV